MLFGPSGGDVQVTIPVGALLYGTFHDARVLMGMASVRWEGRRYSVNRNDLLNKAELVAAA